MRKFRIPFQTRDSAPSSERLLIENKIRMLSHYHHFITSYSPNIFK